MAIHNKTGAAAGFIMPVAGAARAALRISVAPPLLP